MTRAVRGAIQVGENSRRAIEDSTVKLVNEVLRANGIEEQQIVSIIFSVTEDLRAANPATSIRREGFARTPLFCTQEPRVDGGMERVIRVLVTFESADRREVVPVYLDGAEALRADLGHGDRQ
jgi:chorismate mutase